MKSENLNLIARPLFSCAADREFFVTDNKLNLPFSTIHLTLCFAQASLLIGAVQLFYRLEQGLCFEI